MKRKVVSMLIVPVILSATSVTSTFADSEKDALKSTIDQNKIILNEEYEEYSVLSDYDENGKKIKETVYDSFGNIINQEISTYAVINPGGMNYKRIDSFTTTSKLTDKLHEWQARFLAALIPGGLTKNVWVAAAAGSTFETFYNPPKTKYYRTNIYQAVDSIAYYGKSETKKYSDSNRTKLEQTHVKYCYRRK